MNLDMIALLNERHANLDNEVEYCHNNNWINIAPLQEDTMLVFVI